MAENFTAGGLSNSPTEPAIPPGGRVVIVGEAPLAGLLARQVLDSPDLRWLAPLAREYLKERDGT